MDERLTQHAGYLSGLVSLTRELGRFGGSMKSIPWHALVVAALVVIGLVAVGLPITPFSVNVPGLPEWAKPVPLMPEKVIIEAGGQWIPEQTYTPQDTLPVYVAIQITDSDTTATITIDGTPVIVDSIHVDITPMRLRWGLYEEIASNGDLATGVSWHPIHLWGISLGPTASTNLSWAQAGGRIVYPVHTTLTTGLEVGYRFFEDDGLHIGFSLGFDF